MYDKTLRLVIRVSVRKSSPILKQPNILIGECKICVGQSSIKKGNLLKIIGKNHQQLINAH